MLFFEGDVASEEKKRMLVLNAQRLFGINTNVTNNFTVPVGCVPRTHRLIGVIRDHALQGYKGI